MVKPKISKRSTLLGAVIGVVITVSSMFFPQVKVVVDEIVKSQQVSE